MPSQPPARLPSYYLSVGSERKMQMFVSLKIESVTAKLRAICKNRGTNSLKCLYGRERRVSARGLTDCSIRKPITASWTNLPWCFNKSPAFLTLRTILLLPLDFVAGFCGTAAPLLLSVLQSCLAIWDMQAETLITTELVAKPFITICILCKWAKTKRMKKKGMKRTMMTLLWLTRPKQAFLCWAKTWLVQIIFLSSLSVVRLMTTDFFQCHFQLLNFIMCVPQT